jgi:hypothetical protein
VHPHDRTEIDGIPVTSLARTLLDLAEVVPATELRRAYEAAERHRVLDVKAVHELLQRSNGRRGVSALLALLDYDPEPATHSKSDLESMFLDLVRESGLPLPALNVLVEGDLVDAYWPRAVWSSSFRAMSITPTGRHSSAITPSSRGCRSRGTWSSRSRTARCGTRGVRWSLP